MSRKKKAPDTGLKERKTMNTVQRTRGIRKIIRANVFGKPVQKHVTAGDRACGRIMREARSGHQKPGPSDSAILAWARFDLMREILGGFWEARTASPRSPVTYESIRPLRAG